MMRAKLLTLAILLGNGLAIAQTASTTSSTASTTSTTAPATSSAPAALEFDVGKDGRVLMLPVTYKGKTYSFLLDTALTWSGVDKSFMLELGQPKSIAKVATPGGELKLPLYDAPDIRLGPLPLAGGGPILCEHLRPFRFLLGEPIDGLIGMSALKGRIVQIDFDAGKVRLLTAGKPRHDDWGQAHDLIYVDGVPAVRVRVGDAVTTMILDTGCDGAGYLTAELFEKALAKAKSPTTQTVLYTAAGPRRVRQARLPALTLGTTSYKGVILSEGRQCVLGLSFLARHTVTLDFVNHKLYLKKGKAFDRPQQRDMSGLRLFRKDGRTIVHSCEDGSPSAAAGLARGDVLAKLDGRDAGKLDLFDIRRILSSQDGREVTLIVRRGDEDRTVTIRLKQRL